MGGAHACCTGKVQDEGLVPVHGDAVCVHLCVHFWEGIAMCMDAHGCMHGPCMRPSTLVVHQRRLNAGGCAWHGPVT